MQAVETGEHRRIGTIVRIAGWSAAALLLAAPLVAMRFTHEVNWSPTDFAAAGTLILGAGLTLELAAMKSRSLAYRAGAALAVLTAFLMTWAAMAVGLVADPGDPADLLYGLVIAGAAVGAVMVRFEPRGLARVVLLAAGAQLLMTGAAVFAMGRTPEPVALGILCGLFPAMLLASAWLFGQAARARP